MMWPIYNKQRSMAAEEDAERRKMQEEEETSSGTGVSPTVITGLSSASPSNILVNQSSNEEHTSVDIVDDDDPKTINEQVLEELILLSNEDLGKAVPSRNFNSGDPLLWQNYDRTTSDKDSPIDKII